MFPNNWQTAMTQGVIITSQSTLAELNQALVYVPPLITEQEKANLCKSIMQDDDILNKELPLEDRHEASTAVLFEQINKEVDNA